MYLSEGLRRIQRQLSSKHITRKAGLLGKLNVAVKRGRRRAKKNIKDETGVTVPEKLAPGNRRVTSTIAREMGSTRRQLSPTGREQKMAFAKAQALQSANLRLQAHGDKIGTGRLFQATLKSFPKKWTIRKSVTKGGGYSAWSKDQTRAFKARVTQKINKEGTRASARSPSQSAEGYKRIADIKNADPEVAKKVSTLLKSVKKSKPPIGARGGASYSLN